MDKVLDKTFARKMAEKSRSVQVVQDIYTYREKEKRDSPTVPSWKKTNPGSPYRAVLTLDNLDKVDFRPACRGKVLDKRLDKLAKILAKTVVPAATAVRAVIRTQRLSPSRTRTRACVIGKTLLLVAVLGSTHGFGYGQPQQEQG